MKRLFRAAVLLAGAVLVAPILLAAALAVLLGIDLAWWFFGRRKPAQSATLAAGAASIVIPNWNGRDLLEKYLPSVVTAAGQNPGNEIIVVDNGSSDGSADFLRTQFPSVRVIALPENYGFGGGSNAGFRAAKNDIVVLLNSDMRVEPGFLAPLLSAFAEPDVFAVSCQIYLTDQTRRREETGLTEGWWEYGRLQVSHREDPKVLTPFPCFYAGGGSSAFDRRKFLELGGFDELLAPFYLEDTDLGYMAWKRGWKVLYQPASVVYHEHRGTIGRKFDPRYIDAILKKNFLLFTWKNIHEWPRLISSFLSAWTGCIAAGIGGDRPGRPNLMGILRAIVQVFRAAGSRWRARTIARVSDSEAFLRTRGSHYRDRFLPMASTESDLPRVLFVSPYPILPTSHGGAVFMHETLRELAKFCEVHAFVLLDEATQAEANSKLDAYCASVEMMVRPRNQLHGSLLPHPVVEFQSRDVRWLIDRMVFQYRIDIIQAEYTPMGQYLEAYKHIVTALFEHDVYFQSVARNAAWMAGLARLKARIEYLRALPYELSLLKRCDQVQVCTRQNRDYLLEFEPGLASRVRAGLRASINTKRYAFPGGPRRPNTLLFIGSSRHEPNRIAIEWFVAKAFPEVVSACPGVRLYLAGFTSETNPDMATSPEIEMLGTVEDVPLLEACSVFICPVLSGSGVRVKLLEAFSAGIPVVSTRIGAEGLASEDGEFCALADTPEDFAARAIEMLRNRAAAELMAARARAEMEKSWDSEPVAARLYESYRELLTAKAGPIPKSF